MNRYRVYFNTHEYSDTSDTPRSASRIVKADSEELARDILVTMRHHAETVGTKHPRYIGLIFHAELLN